MNTLGMLWPGFESWSTLKMGRKVWRQAGQIGFESGCRFPMLTRSKFLGVAIKVQWLNVREVGCILHLDRSLLHLLFVFVPSIVWIFWLLNLRLPTMGIPVRLGLVPGIASFVQDIIALLTRYLWIPGFSNSTSMNLLEDHGLWYLQFPHNFWLAARPEVAWRFKPVRSASAFVGQRHVFPVVLPFEPYKSLRKV